MQLGNFRSENSLAKNLNFFRFFYEIKVYRNCVIDQICSGSKFRIFIIEAIFAYAFSAAESIVQCRHK